MRKVSMVTVGERKQGLYKLLAIRGWRMMMRVDRQNDKRKKWLTVRWRELLGRDSDVDDLMEQQVSRTLVFNQFDGIQDRVWVWAEPFMRCISVGEQAAIASGKRRWRYPDCINSLA
jgi:hypothetical protein